MICLGVNVDHVATVRQARRTTEPDPVAAAVLAELGGADSIICHLREDRRHVQERDVRVLRSAISTRLNLEMGLSPEIIAIALEIAPDQVTFVPERRQELTTEGGLDVVGLRRAVEEAVRKFRAKGIRVNLFVDPDARLLEAAARVEADMVEIHTGVYANSKSEREEEAALNAIREGVFFARNLRLRIAAGHGLTYRNVGRVAAVAGIEELNIGHSIVSRAVLVGMERAVHEMKELIRQAGA